MSGKRKEVQRNDSENPSASFIFLHGFGDDADGWTNIAEQFRAAKKLAHLNWIFPTALHSHTSGTTAWFEPHSFSPIPVGRSSNANSNTNPSTSPSAGEDPDAAEEEDQQGILDAIEYTCTLIDSEVSSGIPLERIVIGGFSQGCFVTLAAALGSRYSGRIAGVVGLSGGLSRGRKVVGSFEKYSSSLMVEKGKDVAEGEGGDMPKEDGEEKKKEMKVFLAHGDRDMLVPIRIFRETVERVQGIVGEGNVQSHVYQGLGHSTSGREFLDMCRFLERVVPE